MNSLEHTTAEARKQTSIGVVREALEQSRIVGTALISGGILIAASMVSDALLSDPMFHDTTHIAYYLNSGALFIGSVLLLAGLFGFGAHYSATSWSSKSGLLLSGIGFGLMMTGSGAQLGFAALGQASSAELVGFIFAIGMILAVIGSLPLGIAVQRGSEATLTRIGGILLISTLPVLVASMTILATNDSLSELILSVYPFAWVVLGYAVWNSTRQYSDASIASTQ